MSEDCSSQSPRSSKATDALDAKQVARLEDALERLRPRDREIYLAAARDRMAYSDIAGHHRMSVAKVQRIIARVLVRLHDAVWAEAPPRTIASRIAGVFYAVVRRR
jgi:DNA-directed RNA polymerase specialized sigma24 family protein